nr:Vms1/Ankzf1 family peptidyl-tRNA hydrolase [Rathayibacter sp. VKM Ac-2630]
MVAFQEGWPLHRIRGGCPPGVRTICRYSAADSASRRSPPSGCGNFPCRSHRPLQIAPAPADRTHPLRIALRATPACGSVRSAGDSSRKELSSARRCRVERPSPADRTFPCRSHIPLQIVRTRSGSCAPRFTAPGVAAPPPQSTPWSPPPTPSETVRTRWERTTTDADHSRAADPRRRLPRPPTGLADLPRRLARLGRSARHRLRARHRRRRRAAEAGGAPGRHRRADRAAHRGGPAAGPLLPLRRRRRGLDRAVGGAAGPPGRARAHRVRHAPRRRPAAAAPPRRPLSRRRDLPRRRRGAPAPPRRERPEEEGSVQGRTDTLHKAQAGGWRHDRFHSHAEEIWRQTQAELASSVDEIVRTRRPQLLVVAGDIHARRLLAEQLSPSSAAILAVLPANTRADGSDDGALDEFVQEQIDRLLRREKEDVLDALRTHDGRHDNTVEFSLGAIVQALSAAQVDTLVIDTQRLSERELLALAAEPWVAAAPEEALGAEVIGPVGAALALVRAALLTDARVLCTDSRTAPDGEDVVALPHDADAAALLRWRTGPPVPGA